VLGPRATAKSSSMFPPEIRDCGHDSRQHLKESSQHRHLSNRVHAGTTRHEIANLKITVEVRSRQSMSALRSALPARLLFSKIVPKIGNKSTTPNVGAATAIVKPSHFRSLC
jgi:hypothetical protein